MPYIINGRLFACRRGTTLNVCLETQIYSSILLWESQHKRLYMKNQMEYYENLFRASESLRTQGNNSCLIYGFGMKARHLGKLSEP